MAGRISFGISLVVVAVALATRKVTIHTLETPCHRRATLLHAFHEADFRLRQPPNSIAELCDLCSFKV